MSKISRSLVVAVFVALILFLGISDFTYINNIGNLALLSRPLNSENSNAVWSKKRKNIEYSQFILTNSIKEIEKWNDITIKNRCEEITKLSLEYIKGPIERKRDFETDFEK